MESEWLLAFAEAGHPIEFVPVQVIYRDECSKIQWLRDAWRWFRWVRCAEPGSDEAQDWPAVVCWIGSAASGLLFLPPPALHLQTDF